MFGSLRRDAGQAQAAEQVAAWTRQRFQLAEDASVLVSEMACGQPGCPPLETVVAFWNESLLRHQFKVFKPIAQINPDDLPYAWQKRSLAGGEGDDCC
ncbi:MAG: hypothetical protein M3Z16_01645 [Pseudomonadota bacterium]|nr:hypothetical protein [Pseudomonadota bacterium]